ncbi:MAG: methyltransferase domain-containing protein [Balneolaceae bacterium]
MPFFLGERQPHLVEIMDRDDCDPVLLENTYRQFGTINLLLSQWKKIYEKELKPLMNKSTSFSLLDIGFGGGDVPIKLNKWAKEDGFDLKITAIETDRRAFDYVQSIKAPDSITFRHCSSTDLVQENRQFDFVISNHVLHHLNQKLTDEVLQEAKTLAGQKAIFNDIERSDVGYLLFTTFARLVFRRSFITADGLTSIKRSYTFRELTEMAPDGWAVKRVFPFRLLLIYEFNQ